MELSQLRYFLIVADMGHMTKASKKLNISQPVLSRSIGKLEEELGVPLFDRVGRRIKLNDYGKMFQKNIKQVIKLLDYSVQEVQDFDKIGTYEISIQISAIAELATQLICDFSAQHHNINFRLQQNEAHTSNNQFDDFDLLLTSARTEDKIPNSITLFSEKIALGVSENHPLSKYDTIELSQIENENFVDRNPDNNFRKLTDTFCREAGIRRNVAFECDSPQMLISFVKKGMGVGFIGEKAVKIDGIKLLRVTDVNCERFVELQWRENYYRNKGVREFIDFAQKYFKNYR